MLPKGWKHEAQARTGGALDDSVPKGLKPRLVKCKVCGRTLEKDKDLVQHMGVHEVTRLGCDKCDPGYRRGDEMKKHKRERHENSGVYTKDDDTGSKG